MNEYLLGRSRSAKLTDLERGEDVYLYDSAGRKLLDGVSGAMVANFGYSDDEILDALSCQSQRLPFAHSMRFRTDKALEVAELLARSAPFGDYRVLFGVTGSDAVEAALRIAILARPEKQRKHPPKLLALSHGYHGSTLGSLSLTAARPVRGNYEDILFPVGRIPAAYCYRCPMGLEFPGCKAACADSLSARLEDSAISAVFVEPIIANAGGSIVPPMRYMRRIQDACTEFDVPLIVDEVATGLGRCGHAWASAIYDLRPDIICTGKGLTAGYYPMSAVLVKKELIDRLDAGANVLGHTYSGNPVACAIASVVLKRLNQSDLLETVANKGNVFGTLLREKLSAEYVGDIRGRGLLWSIELVGDSQGTPFPRSLRISERVVDSCRARGLIALGGAGYADGVNGDHVTLAPAFTTSDQQLEDIVSLLQSAMSDVCRRG